MASATVPFRLKSYQTALAIVLPTQLHPEINSLRKIHDKAFERWEPHLNVLYPFVEPEQLDSAIAQLRQDVEKRDLRSLDISLTEVDKFVQRKAATVHLKPTTESQDRITELRANLIQALGRNAREGTHDGIYRAHLTIGQAGLLGPTLDRLVGKVTKLAPLEWRCVCLAVLKREASGKMMLVDRIWFDGEETSVEIESKQINEGDEEKRQGMWQWNVCNTFTDTSWHQLIESRIIKEVAVSLEEDINVFTYNLMTEDHAPPFPTRLPLIVDAISSAIHQSSHHPSVLCLQEASDEMLPLLLADPTIRRLYPFSTHHPSSLLPSHRNLITLASVPFTYTTIPFDERHKSALVVDLVGMNIKVINTHLSSALSDAAVLTKQSQMIVLAKFCQDQASFGTELIIAGDFNLTTSSLTIETALRLGIIQPNTAQLVKIVIDPDVWEDAFLTRHLLSHDGTEGVLEGEEGATFDRIGNPLAAMSSAPIDNRPQRYDRVIFKPSDKISVKHAQLFGRPNVMGSCGSDHYGFATMLHIDRTPAKYQTVLRRESAAEIIVAIEDSTDLVSFYSEWLPTEDDRTQRKRAIDLVRDTLMRGPGFSDLILASLGSYLMGTYLKDSDVDMLAIGSVSSQTFFQFAATKLQSISTDAEDGVKGVHLVNSLVSILEISVLGIKFDLQYCQAPVLLKRFHSESNAAALHELAFDATLISSLPPSSLRPFNTYRDTAYILSTIADLDSYRTAHRFLSLSLKARGLYSAKFGYLGGIHLSLMLNRVMKLLQGASSSATISPASIVRTFFNYYGSFSWPSNGVTDPNTAGKTQSPRTPRDSVFIPAIHVPTARPNVASSCTPLSARTFSEEFKKLSDNLSGGEWASCLRSDVAIKDFLTGFSAYISISLDVWGLDEIHSDKVREIIGTLESKMPRLMLSLGRFDDIYARVWPYRFHSRTSDSTADHTQLQGNYLIGIRMDNESADLETKKILRSKVVGAVRDFETSLRSTKEFESGNCWLSTDFLSGKKIRDMDMILDQRNWSGIKTRLNTNDQERNPGGHLHLDEPLNPRTASTTGSRSPRAAPLRVAHDIINRIKHDTDHYSPEEYLIGYVDRFEDAPKEVELLKWKLEQTDEEFIPLHRVIHIRRKDENGGEILWDRKRRLDLVFGSGRASV